MEVSSIEINTLINRDEILGNYNHIHDFYSIHTKSERDIIIWLPPSYTESIKSYPVLYIHDGQNVFNPSTAFTGYDWKADETANYLIQKKIIREMIIVGIYNTKDRLQEYNLFTSKGMAYSNFIIKELKPYIDENYRTLTSKENTCVLGSSMGGLCSFQLAMNFPNTFGNACCMSSSFWVDNKQIFDFMKFQNYNSNLKIYLDCGTNETQLLDDSIKMCALLRDLGFTQKNFYCYFDENGNHSEVDWSKRLYIPLTFIYGINGKASELLYSTSRINSAS